MWFSMTSAALASTLSVGPTGSHATIADAVAAAQPGDVIEIEAGTFVERVDIEQSLTLRGAGRELTTIEYAGPENDALSIEFATNVVIEDLTVVGTPEVKALRILASSGELSRVSLRSTPGVGTARLAEVDRSLFRFHDIDAIGAGGTPSNGGLFDCDKSDVVFEDATFEDGVAESGGAVAIRDSSAAFVRSTFRNNRAVSGGAVMVSGPPTAPVRFEECLFEDNLAETAEGDGGALVITNNPTTIVRSTFRGNRAVDDAGAIQLDFSPDSRLEDNRFENNVSGTAGALYLQRPLGVRVRRNVFVDNEAALGAAILVTGAGAFDVHGNHLCGGDAEEGGAVAVIAHQGTLAGTLRNNLWIDNQATTGGSALFSTGNSVLDLDNNTFHGSATSAILADPPGVLGSTNNAFVDLGSSAIVGGAEVSLSYSLFWEATAPERGAQTHLIADPEFMDPVVDCTATLRPSPTSPLIDAGDPAILDVDGSPSDIGAYGGPGAVVWDLDGDGVTDEDCAPTDPAISTPTDEIIGDGIDQDCDGLDLCYLDLDEDGLGGPDVAAGDCTAPGLSSETGDCSDTDPALTTDCEPAVENSLPRAWFCQHAAPAPFTWLLLVALVGIRRRGVTAR